MFYFALVALLCCGLLGYQGATSELTGKAVYHPGFGRGQGAEPVLRQDSPAKFREATNFKWAFSAVFGLASLGAFVCYRKV